MTAYVDLLTLMNQAQRGYAHLTDLIGRLQETPEHFYLSLPDDYPTASSPPPAKIMVECEIKDVTSGM
jgi:hypothetical protein